MRTSLRLIVVFLIVALPAGAADLSGQIEFLTRRGQRPVVTETLVWLESAAPVEARPAGTFEITTRSKVLIPHVLAIPIGSVVEFPNEDPISHNLFSLSGRNKFDLGYYRRGAGKSEKFADPGIVNVYCNVHPGMSAVIHVMATPWYTFADREGRYRLQEVPPGRYRLVAWNEIGGTTQHEIVVQPNERVRGPLDLTIDGRSYRQQQHLNKDGKAYTRPRGRDY